MIKVDFVKIGQLIDWLKKEHKIYVLRKEERTEAQIAASLFGVGNAIDSRFLSVDEFMRCATTIGPFIYMPDGLNPMEYLSVLVHEVQHVFQFWQGTEYLKGGFGFWWLYLSQPEARCDYEVDANHAQFEFAFFAHGLIPSLEGLRFPLEDGYLFDEEMKEFGKDQLDQRLTSSIKSKQPFTKSAKMILEYIKRNNW